jgi:putative toxin-antitoxin system antitoxin component (TIGR02293 family)
MSIPEIQSVPSEYAGAGMDSGTGDPERVAELEDATEEIIRRAVEVIGSKAEAMRWLGLPVRALDYATPISLLHTAQGCEAVRTVLGRLEHGVL